jgi:hypothetical protein
MRKLDLLGEAGERALMPSFHSLTSICELLWEAASTWLSANHGIANHPVTLSARCGRCKDSRITGCISTFSSPISKVAHVD